jgi:hypothetical protein
LAQLPPLCFATSFYRNSMIFPRMKDYSPRVEPSILCSSFAKGKMPPTVAAVDMMSMDPEPDQGYFKVKISRRHENLQC